MLSITNMLKVAVKAFTAMALLKEFTNGHEARWCKWLPGGLVRIVSVIYIVSIDAFNIHFIYLFIISTSLRYK